MKQESCYIICFNEKDLDIVNDALSKLPKNPSISNETYNYHIQSLKNEGFDIEDSKDFTSINKLKDSSKYNKILKVVDVSNIQYLITNYMNINTIKEFFDKNIDKTLKKDIISIAKIDIKENGYI